MKHSRGWYVVGNSIRQNTSYDVTVNGIPRRVYDSKVIAQRVNNRRDAILIAQAPAMFAILSELLDGFTSGEDGFTLDNARIDLLMERTVKIIQEVEE